MYIYISFLGDATMQTVTSDVPILEYRYQWYWPIFVVSANNIGIGKYSRYLPILFKHKINIKNFCCPLELDWISNIINDFFLKICNNIVMIMIDTVVAKSLATLENLLKKAKN